MTNKISQFNNLFLAILFMLLASCTSAIPSDNPSNISPFANKKERIVWLNNIQTWEVSGRFAIKKADKGTSGSFEWYQYATNNYQIHFYGPFGAGNTHLTGIKNQVVWEDSDGKTIAPTPDILVYEKTGFIFPVSYLHDWILGRPALNNDSSQVQEQQFDSQGRLIHFYQSGWSVNYLAYSPIKNGELPVRMELEHDNFKLKLLMNDWKIITHEKN